ncbi:hypothetical protein [Nocardia thailandica]|uniref:hypothetical protein n=1 Tax=Nocardia thailandica TaxID=257275 RepID=UPI0002DB0D80|nr:hypothetical protein [Nocardia thailandica]
MTDTQSGADIREIGTVEILKWRIYPLDAALADEPLATHVSVQPGIYPLYREADAFFWLMTGQINVRGARKIGDGLFDLSAGDGGRGPQVTFPSKTFGRKEFHDLLGDACCLPGPQQRLRVDLNEEVSW